MATYRNKNEERDNVILDLLDDLTHLEINTLVKSGMTGEPTPEHIEEVLFRLFDEYLLKLNVILSNNSIGYTKSKKDEEFKSF
jgi:hypothetical protein